MTRSWTIHHSPLGPLALTGSEPGRLQSLHFPGRAGTLQEGRHAPDGFTEVCTQLDEYFAGQLQRFVLPLQLGGTSFQERVWQQLSEIPYGTTRSYTQIAEAIGRPDRVRAVAAAIGRTPVPIIIPCHRAVAANGDLTGYLGGLARKRALLDLEADVARGETSPAVWYQRQLVLL
jgi:methylated-DNA-[protein]-cysteine S-methyltransferase